MSNRIRLLLIGLAIVVVAVLAWFFALSPVRDDIAAAEAQIEEEQARLSEAQIKLAQAESTKEEGRRNQARLLELAKMMPTSEEIPSLLLQIQDLADQSGIQFIAITPGETKDSESGAFRVLPLSLEFSGTFFDVSDFIWRAEQMSSGPGRLLAIKQLQLGLAGNASESAAGVSPTLSVTMTIYAFLAEEQGGSAPAAQSGAGAAQDTTTSTPAANESTAQ
jgi:Tfp pilus assembly protein PilO